MSKLFYNFASSNKKNKQIKIMVLDKLVKEVSALKQDALTEIKDLIGNGEFMFKDSFYVHYIEGEVATTEICKGISYDNDATIDKVKLLTDNAEEPWVDLVDAYDVGTFADILQHLYDERSSRLKELRGIVKRNGGEINFDGNYKFIGQIKDGNNLEYFDDNTLYGLSLVDDKLVIDDSWEGNEYTNYDDYLSLIELDKVLKYVTSNLKEVRIKFSADVYIQGKDIDEIKSKFECMRLFADTDDANIEFNEVLLVEDADTNKDLMDEWNNAR